MGLFDYVRVQGEEYVCSEGHNLEQESFQSKDFGCTMGTVSLGGVGITVTMEDGGYGHPEIPGLTDYVEVYGDCTRCPAFVQMPTGNLVATWVTFKVHIVKDVVQGVERTSQSTADFLAKEPGQKWMEGCLGPMSYQDAYTKHIEMVRERLFTRKS